MIPIFPAILDAAPLLLLGIALYLVLIPVARLLPRPVQQYMHRAGRAAARLGKRPVLSVVSVGIASLIVCMLTSLFAGMRLPEVQDEFAYLLTADTFAHGRLANPSPPMWKSFETGHVILEPTYAAKYPIGQSLALAAGQVIFGHPAVGLWISVALACAATCWMMRVWLPPRWALLGALMVVVHPLILHWNMWYMGGAVAMLGGALVLGAARQIAIEGRRVRALNGAAFGLGLGILANTRPNEGFILSLMVGFALLVWMLRRKQPTWGMTLRRIVVPAAVVLTPIAAFVLYYNYRVTGEPARMPYMVHEDRYSMAPIFIWQKPGPPRTYYNAMVRGLHEWQLAFHQQQQHIKGFVLRTIRKWGGLVEGYVADMPPLFLGLLGLYWVLRRERGLMRVALQMFLIYVLLLSTQTWLRPHYIAPAAALVFVLLLQGLRHVFAWGRRLRGQRVGRVLLRAFFIFCVIWLIPTWWDLEARNRKPWVVARAGIQNALSQREGLHLVLVRYAPDHNIYLEWVYNGADLENGKVIWARELDDVKDGLGGEAQNQLVLEHYRNRRVWLVDADDPAFKLRPYTPEIGE